MQKVYVTHPDGTGFRVMLEGSGDESFTSSTFSPDGTRLTIGIYPGVGRKGNADIWIANLEPERADRPPHAVDPDASVGELTSQR